MTPAVTQVKKARVQYTLHQYKHDPAAPSYGEEAAEKLGVDPKTIFKTLVVQLDNGKLAVGIVPVAGQLNLKSMAAACGARKAAMADQHEAAKSTGYLPGGISPLGQKKRLKTVLDKSAEQFATIHVSAGKRGLEVELAPEDLIRLTNGQYGDITRV